MCTIFFLAFGTRERSALSASAREGHRVAENIGATFRAGRELPLLFRSSGHSKSRCYQTVDARRAKNLPLFEIARLLVCLIHVASFIVNANHSLRDVTGCKTSHSRLRSRPRLVRRTTGGQTAAHRKLDRPRDDLCVGGPNAHGAATILDRQMGGAFAINGSGILGQQTSTRNNL
jgi:hypothetical protein